VQCPGRLILETYDLAQALRDAGVAVVGGFHSPMERECLRLLLRGKQAIVVCPARSIERLRPPEAWRAALAAGRLLVLSPFDPGQRRATTELARQRNRVVAALADQVFVAYAAPGSRTEAFAREVATSGKPLLTLEAPENAALVALGARPIQPASFRKQAAFVRGAPPGPPGAVPLPLFDAEKSSNLSGDEDEEGTAR
jgi:predicted Rossmann fold nucleotide-binding protein DprA/Smf involved in DNA uptake